MSRLFRDCVAQIDPVLQPNQVSRICRDPAYKLQCPVLRSLAGVLAEYMTKQCLRNHASYFSLDL